MKSISDTATYFVVMTIILVFITISCSTSDPRHKGISVVSRNDFNRFERMIYRSNYQNSKLIAVGVDDYLFADDLRYAVDDARAIVELLKSRGFEIVEIYDRDATKQNVMRVIESELYDTRHNDRIVVFYAGHGVDLESREGDKKGYLIPADGDCTAPDTLIPLDWLQIDLSSNRHIAAKHILFILDACSSGIIASRSAIIVDDSTSDYISELIKRKARQVITAGTGKQQVWDGGYKGHSVFTGYILQGIENNLADTNNDYHITATELALFLSEKVYMRSKGAQKPDFAKLLGTEGGEVILKFPNEREKSILKEKTKYSGPKQGELVLEVHPLECHVSIFNKNGDLVKEGKCLNGMLSFSNLDPDDYHVLIESVDKKYQPIKMILGIYDKTFKKVDLSRKPIKLSCHPSFNFALNS